MRAVLLEVPQSLIDERRLTGVDRLDEMWEGELHMAPQPMFGHQWKGSHLVKGLWPGASGLGLEVVYESGLWATGEEPESYRVPDVVVVHPDRISARGLEAGTAPLLVVEIRSPDDESYLKLPFYGRVGVTEVVIVDEPAGVLRQFVGDGRTMSEVTCPDGVRSIELGTLPGVSVSLTDDAVGLRVDVA